MEALTKAGLMLGLALAAALTWFLFRADLHRQWRRLRTESTGIRAANTSIDLDDRRGAAVPERRTRD